MAVEASLAACLARLRDLVASLEHCALDVDSLDGAEACALAKRFAAGEHACAAARALCARRVAETSHHEREGYKDPAAWFAAISGDSHGGSKRLLQTMGDLASGGAAQAAFLSGELSPSQASEISAAVAVDASAEEELLETARKSSLSELRDAAEAVKAAARSEEESRRRHERIHRARNLRTWNDRDGSFGGRFSLTPEDGAVVLSRLESIANDMFDVARRQGRREPRAAYLADALVALAGGEAPADTAPCVRGAPQVSKDSDAPGGDVEMNQAPASEPGARSTCTACGRRSSRPDVSILMHIDLEALARGHLLPGEESVIQGGGHVPVSVVQRYLDTAKLRLVVTKGVDIASVVSFSRVIPAAIRTALEHRDRCCVVPGCSSTFHLEIDHIQPHGEHGPTSLANLCRLCRFHHSLKSQKGYRIEGGPGRWRWIAPRGAPRDGPDG